MIEETELKRSFGGKIDNFKNKHEANFEKKHLKAYIAGHKSFRIGIDEFGRPYYTPVKEVWKPIIKSTN